jgi:hypothetical protein
VSSKNSFKLLTLSEKFCIFILRSGAMVARLAHTQKVGWVQVPPPLQMAV